MGIINIKWHNTHNVNIPGWGPAEPAEPAALTLEAPPSGPDTRPLKEP